MPKIQQGWLEPHPLVAPPSFAPGTPHEVSARFVEAHYAHRVHAEEEVRKHREAAAREHARLHAVHPLIARQR
jgi:hypothetical protein